MLAGRKNWDKAYFHTYLWDKFPDIKGNYKNINMSRAGIYFSLFVSILLIPNLLYNQTAEKTFPESWEGIWKGELQIYKENNLAQSVPMELHILELDTSDSYTWTIIYGSDKESGKRPYELKIIDPKKGIYAIDEKNSIVLDAYFFRDKFFSRFEVMGSYLLCTYQKVEEQIVFEIISGKMEPMNTTGDQMHKGEKIPQVKSFQISVMQRANLTKK